MTMVKQSRWWVWSVVGAVSGDYSHVHGPQVGVVMKWVWSGSECSHEVSVMSKAMSPYKL